MADPMLPCTICSLTPFPVETIAHIMLQCGVDGDCGSPPVVTSISKLVLHGITRCPQLHTVTGLVTNPGDDGLCCSPTALPAFIAISTKIRQANLGQIVTAQLASVRSCNYPNYSRHGLIDGLICLAGASFIHCGATLEKRSSRPAKSGVCGPEAC